MQGYAWSSAVTLLALMVYFWNTIEVGRARARHGIQAPAISGNADFERVFRIQQNMLEQLVFFLPALWLFAVGIEDRWAGFLGGIWVLGRVLYSVGYAKAAEKRSAGFGIAMLSGLVLLVGAIVGWFLR